MSNSSTLPPLRSDVTLIEIGDEAVGLAVREGSGFRFFAATVALRAIDSQLFGSLKQLRRSAAGLGAGRRPAAHRRAVPVAA